MKPPASPLPFDTLDEPGRIAAVRSSGLLAAGPSAALDDLIGLATRLLSTSSAEINLVGADELTFVAARGLGTPGETVPRKLTFCTETVADPDRPLVVADAREDVRFAENPFVLDGTIRFYAGFPLIVDGQPIGTMCVHDPRPNLLDQDQLDTLRVLARAAQSQLSLMRDVGDLHTEARTDALTGCANRRATDEALGRDLHRAAAAGTPVCVALLDLDRFKVYNDTMGHQAGDLLLQRSAQAWRQSLRPGDLLGRWGGEEFCVLLPGTTADQASAVAERLRAVMPDGQTCSVGVAQWDHEEDAADLIGRADAALYEAKHGGRDRTVVAG